MPEDFDRFLASALAPDDRQPDRKFVAGVQARIALEEQLAAQRRSLVSALVMQMIGLAAVAATIWLVARAAPVAEFFAPGSWLGVATLLAAFAFIVLLFSSAGGGKGTTAFHG